MAHLNLIFKVGSRSITFLFAMLLLLFTCNGVTKAENLVSDLSEAERLVFLGMLDLDKAELQGIRQAHLIDGNTTEACKKYIAYFRTKKITSYLLKNWSAVEQNPGHDVVEADQLLQGLVWDGISTYDVSKEGLDWHNTPVSGLTRFPMFGVMREAIHHTGNPNYIRYVVDHIKGYDKAYPIVQFIGKSTKNGWTNYSIPAKPWYWNMISHRISQFAETIAIIRNSPHVSDEELLVLLRRFYLEAKYLRNEIPYWVDRRHNGGLMMIKAMAQICDLLSDFKEVPVWKNQNVELAGKYVENAFYPDGMCVELSTAYCIAASKDAQNIASAFANEKAFESTLETLSQLITCQKGLSDPTSLLPSFGDLHAGKLDGALYGPALDQVKMQWAGSTSSGTQTSVPEFLVWPKPGQEQWSGYYTMRSGWNHNARYLVIDCGPWGTNHQHGDRLSFAITAHGEQFIIDPSGTQYASTKPNGIVSRQSAGFLHNTITVDGVDEYKSQGTSDETKLPLKNVWVHGTNYTLFSGNYSFSPLKEIHWERRLVFVNGDYWLLQDVLSGSKDSAQIEQNFQFNDDIVVELNGRQVYAKAPNGARLAIVPLGGDLLPKITKGDKTPHATYWPDGKSGETNLHGRGWTGKGGPDLIPAPAVTFSGTVSLPATLTLAIVPVSPETITFQMPKITNIKEKNRTVWNLPTNKDTIRFVSSINTCTVIDLEEPVLRLLTDPPRN